MLMTISYDHKRTEYKLIKKCVIVKIIQKLNILSFICTLGGMFRSNGPNRGPMSP